MPKPPLPSTVRDLLKQPNPAVIAANRPDGQPVSVATWYLIEDDDRILINMDAGRRRLSYLRNDPRVSLTVLSEGNWGTHVSVQGRVVDLSPDAELAGIDRLAQRYSGGSYPVRDRDRVNGWIDIEFWHAWQLTV
jgi:PPOX class probable F420-dependent enzyme